MMNEKKLEELKLEGLKIIKERKLEKLLNSDDWRERLEAAKCDYGLNKLVKDKNSIVRKIVAKRGYGLEVLVHDEHWGVRKAVAEQGYGLDILVNDESWLVRVAVAEQGFGLEKLVDDKNWAVRTTVALQGYGLDKLINDEEFEVKSVAQYLLGSKVEVLHRNFGTYNGLLYVRIWKDKYEIKSGCYNTNSLEEWSEKCAEQLGQETSDLYAEKIKKLISV